MRNEQLKQNKFLVAFKGNDGKYYYIGEQKPGIVKRAKTSLKIIQPMADNCEDYLYIDNSLLKNKKLLEECQAAVFYYNDVFCVNKFTLEQSRRLKQMMQNQEKQGKTIIVKKCNDGKFKKVKRIDNDFKIETVGTSELDNKQLNELELGKKRIILNGKKLTKSMVGDIIELAMDNKEKQQKEELCKTKTEGIKKQTDSPDRKSEFCTTKDRILRDMEEKLKNARDNLHAMMSKALGKEKTNNYKPKKEIDDNLWYMTEMALDGKKLFNPRNCCFKAGGELIKKLNREFDVLLRLAFKTMCMTYNENNKDCLEKLNVCVHSFDATYKKLTYSTDLRALDGGFLNCIKNIEYEWKDVINDYSAQKNQTKEGKNI